MPIYVGINGEAKLVTEVYIGNKNNYAIPIYLSNIIPKTCAPVSYIYSNTNYSNTNYLGFLDTGITMTPYTKIILIFAPYISTGSKAPNKKYLIQWTTNATTGLGYKNSVYAPAIVEYGSVDVDEYNNTINLLNQLENLGDLPQTYYTYIVNKSGNKDFYIQEDNLNLDTHTSYSLGNNSQSPTTNITTIKLLIQKEAPLCYCAIYQNVLKDFSPTREYYPCVNIDSATPGLYETVEGIFYSNNSIVAGPIITQYTLPTFE